MQKNSIFQTSILIIGGTGSLGKKLIERFKTENYVHVYSRDEAKHWTIRNEIKDEPAARPVEFHVGDIRDKQRVTNILRNVRPGIIIVAAALKQVDTCERVPSESVLTNLIGTQNVIDAVNELYLSGPKPTVLFVSTDKACAPVNVYGMCKAISERIVTSQEEYGNAKFIATRYGNVLESRGSIIPLFKFQAENQGYLTVTDPEMTRFLMTLDDSVNLIEHAILNGKTGETWIPKLPAMRIGDLANIFALKYKKDIKVIGLRPGEKKHEDLINESESTRTISLDDHYVIWPSYIPGDSSKRFTYSSDQSVMSQDELHKHLLKLGIIDLPLEKFSGRNIEEIVRNT